MTKKKYAIIQPATKYIVAAFIVVVVSFLPASAQLPPSNTSVRQIMAMVDSFNNRLPAEKLYLHFDKPYYAVGDTIWFKAYLFKGTTYNWSPLSGLLYVELIDDSDKVVKRMSFPVQYGISWGQIPIAPEEINSGKYTIYAYTNWMQNAGPSCFFREHVAIGDAAGRYWLVKESHRVTAGDMTLAVQLSEADARPARMKNIHVRVADGKKTIFHDDVQTGADGSFKTSFTLPEKTGPSGITLVAEDKTDPSMKVIVPLPVSRPANIDLQFMPESGWLVADLPSQVGFKAIGEDGKGVDLKGKITDSHGREIVSFATMHKGMGVFEFTPAAGETYSAVVALPGGPVRYPLPAIKTSGSILRLTDEGDSVLISIYLSHDMQSSRIYHLVGLARGLVCYGANFMLNKTEVHGRVSKNVFPSGVAHFTLFNDQAQPVNERMVFINQQDNLNIDLSSDKPLYATRDSIGLHILVTDKQQQPVTGTFSLAVTDDEQVKTDSLSSDNIISRLLLSTELKGTVEDPAWYFSQPDPAVAKALDALLLTQGWIGYNWQAIFKKPSPPQFVSQPGFIVTGKVTNLLNKPVGNANVLLMATGKNWMIRDTVTGEDGRFTFYNFPVSDTPSFVVQARNARGKNFGIGLTLDEFTPASIRQEPAIQWLPWNVNSDSTLLFYVKNNYERQLDVYNGDRRFKMLRTVTVKGRKGIRGSLNLNGMGEADQIIDEADIEKAGNKLNLKQLLQKTIKGFTVVYGAPRSRANRIAPGDINETYRINANDVQFVIDGIPLRRFGNVRETLEYLMASDIKGIEVMNSRRYSSSYSSTFLSINEQMNTTMRREYSFIEVTTFSGNGIFMKKVPGVAIYKALPLTWPVKFYSPRYTVKDGSERSPDRRSTIFWQPNLVTDAKGMAETSFYAAARAATYTVILQGSDMNGNIGFRRTKLVVGK